MDKLLTTTNSRYRPSGIGPTESPRAPGLPTRINISRAGDDIVIRWNDEKAAGRLWTAETDLSAQVLARYDGQDSRWTGSNSAVVSRAC